MRIDKDERFRNVAGLVMQAECIKYVLTDGDKGLSSVNELFYKVDELYNADREHFDNILSGFIANYGEF